MAMAGSEYVWTGAEWEWLEKKDTKTSVRDFSNKYGGSFVDSEVIEGSGDDYDDNYDDEDYEEDYNYHDETDKKLSKETNPTPNIFTGYPVSSDDEDFSEGSGDSDLLLKVTDSDSDHRITPTKTDFDHVTDSDHFPKTTDKDSKIKEKEPIKKEDNDDSDIYVDGTSWQDPNKNWKNANTDSGNAIKTTDTDSDYVFKTTESETEIKEKEHFEEDKDDSDIYVDGTNWEDPNNNWKTEDVHEDTDDKKSVYVETTDNEDTHTDDKNNGDIYVESTNWQDPNNNWQTEDVPEDTEDNQDIYVETSDTKEEDAVVDHEVIHTEDKGVYNEVPQKPMVPDLPQSTPTPKESDPEVSSKGPTTIQHPASFFAQPGILAAVIGGAVVGLLCAILLVMFIVYRMRKKDEGSYALDEPKRSHTKNSYSKPPSREFYA